MKPLSKEERGGVVILIAVVALLLAYGLWARGCVRLTGASVGMSDYSVTSELPKDSVEDSHEESTSFSARHSVEKGRGKSSRHEKSGRSFKRQRTKKSKPEEHPRDFLRDNIQSETDNYK
ncbi:MAG: hypothetical protein K2G11_05670 [Muribaculaceae bacterium]|nr:hypothetical protein [Muribaculaceae bacterium]